jgi:hypothetical protein
MGVYYGQWIQIQEGTRALWKKTERRVDVSFEVLEASYREWAPFMEVLEKTGYFGLKCG